MDTAFAGSAFATEGSFTFCSVSIDPLSANYGAGSGAGSVSVTAGASCGWTAINNDPSWLSVTSGSPGSGNGSIGYSVTANSGPARTGTLTIAGQTFTVNQAVGSVSISGTITSGGSPLAGVVMSGLPGNPTTNASGVYTGTVAYNWSGTVTPTLASYSFSPANRTYTNVAANQTAQDYRQRY